MENRKPPSEREVAEWLETGRLDLPPLRFRLSRTQRRIQTGIPDFDIEGRWDDATVKFVVEYKQTFTPKALDDAVRQVEIHARVTGDYPMVILPYLREAQLQELEQRKISGVDLSGNGVVVIPGRLTVFRTGKPNRFSSSAPIKNIYRKNTSMVARLFAVAPVFQNVSMICARLNALNPFVQNGSRTPMQKGTVSKALKALAEDLVIDRTEGIRLLQPEKLLANLVENYEPPIRARRKRVKIPSERQEIGRRIRDLKYPVAATGLSSVRKYAVMARDDMISLYCPRIDELQRRLDAQETDQFANYELIETDEEPLFFDGRKEEGFPWAPPLQTYLELMAGDKRDQETAEQVKSLLLRTMSSGGQ